MPLLLVSIPLKSSRTGVRSWHAPPPSDLPVEMEYLSTEEYLDRFATLDAIARQAIPTHWADLLTGLVIVAGMTGAAIGLKMAPPAQGALFILPIILVLWFRVRKDIMARSTKQFKTQTQRLLRVWTNQDVMQSSIQWKIRLRAVRKHAAATGTTSDVAILQDIVVVDALAIPPSAPDIPAIVVTNPVMTEINRGMQIPTMPISSNTPSTPLQLSLSPEAQSTSVPELDLELRETATEGRGPTLVPESDHVRNQSEGRVQRTCRCVKRHLFNIFGFSSSTRRWMIEISIRECQLDEYTLTVPSPVYNGYRLPFYEESVSLTTAGATTLELPRSRNQSMSSLNRIRGLPPAYESESDHSDDDDDDDDDNHDLDEADEDRHSAESDHQLTHRFGTAPHSRMASPSLRAQSRLGSSTLSVVPLPLPAALVSQISIVGASSSCPMNIKLQLGQGKEQADDEEWQEAGQSSGDAQLKQTRVP